MKQCEICGKGPKMAGKRNKLRGHYNPTPQKAKYPNLQKSTTPEGKRVLACTTCIKTIAKQAVKA
ncbi:MAG: L28 family ribosomal protein [bacterium]|nr:L28 family ribosomal protein [bacterium]MDZ4231231.1 50S ribosomal protein L28 [Patescibacteria group bacterium]